MRRPDQIRELRAALGLDKPFFVQFVFFTGVTQPKADLV